MLFQSWSGCLNLACCAFSTPPATSESPWIQGVDPDAGGGSSSRCRTGRRRSCATPSRYPPTPRPCHRGAAWRRPTEREVLLWRLPVHQQQPHQARSTSRMITRPTARGHRPTRADPTARGGPVWLRTWWTALSLLEHIRYGSVTECLVRGPG